MLAQIQMATVAEERRRSVEAEFARYRDEYRRQQIVEQRHHVDVFCDEPEQPGIHDEHLQYAPRRTTYADSNNNIPIAPPPVPHDYMPVSCCDCMTLHFLFDLFFYMF